MSASRGEKPQIGVFLRSVLWFTVILVSSANASRVFGQDQSHEVVQSVSPQEEHVHGAVIPLKDTRRKV